MNFDLPFMPYDTDKTSFARRLRKTQTYPEKLVRKTILSLRPLGYKFTRQKPLWPYIADFYCAKLLLVIEIDGDIHENNKLYDEARENRMRELCIETIRYTNSTVLTNLEEVEQDILKKLSERNKFFS